jgi:hypothetical protein
MASHTTCKSFHLLCPILVHTDASIASLFSLPCHVLSQVFSFIPRHDLTFVARVATYVKEYAESTLWQHLFLAPNDPNSDLKVQPWTPSAPKQDRYEGLSQRAYQRLVRYVAKRPHVSKSVRTCTVLAASQYSIHLARVINEIGTGLRHLDFTRFDINTTVRNGMVDTCDLWNSIRPMRSLHRLELPLPTQWYDCLCLALNATPFLSELVIRPFPDASLDWDQSPSYGAYASDRPMPCLPYLGLLEIWGISAQSDIALGKLLESSHVANVKLVLRGYGSWKASEEFKASIAKLGDRLELVMELPDPNDAEKEMFRIEEEEAVDAAYKVAMEETLQAIEAGTVQIEDCGPVWIEWCQMSDSELPFSPIFDE